ncbi:uncharacterized protein B0I36DRAFT_326981 [Microdochium trichocladiopsis]|uniref:Tyrosinase copper-binding domain-containing protein n=1 Tax=Microdochium trichocladiopsis TaxID=1682393 RepID=A0A9P8Y1H1_9PEZI|nr:uncharacterized protein B0I36DRAFT_326981 [Microdochium trichocladiopsis]KAH7027376.1 hypothetical protein B0I36DRAFT_326981 [Microdochium trichocladiopsis]
MKFASAILTGAAAVKALSIPQNVDKREELVPITTGFTMKPFLTELVEAVNDGADLTEILTKPAGDILSVGIADVNATIHLGLSTVGLAINSGGRVSDDDVSRIESTAGSASRVGDNARGSCSNPKVRVEWRNMQPVQRKAFVNAIVCLWNAPSKGLAPPATNRYEELVWVHQQMVNKVHQSGMFLIWHRYYTHLFGRMLREECGYPGAYPFPWWDETKDSGNFAASGLFTADYFGALPQLNNGQGTCVTNGPFAGKRLHIGPGGGNQDRCLSRGENRDLTRQVSAAFVNSCNSRSTYAQMRECTEFGPHAYGHNGLGPVMSDVAASPADPVFFLHHAFIDRNFWKWQSQAASRWTDIYACAAPGNPCPIMGLDTVISSMGLRPDVRVRDILDAEGSWLCYSYDY